MNRKKEFRMQGLNSNDRLIFKLMNAFVFHSFIIYEIRDVHITSANAFYSGSVRAGAKGAVYPLILWTKQKI